MSQSPEITFIIAHYNCTAFLKICLQSIRRYTPIPYKVLIGDNGSDSDEFIKIQEFLNPGQEECYLFPQPEFWHPTILERLYQTADSRYIVTLDQDCVLLTDEWISVFDDFRPEHRLLAGARDLCGIRCSPQMVHVSFVVLDKLRIKEHLQDPIFYGEIPGYHQYQIRQPESYHALACKALQYHPDAIAYLEPFDSPDYGFGTFWLRDRKPIAYHQWYSGRIANLPSTSSIDGTNVQWLAEAKSRFLDDYHQDSLKIPQFK